MALSPKQQRFVEEYLKDLNASAAYRRAGYAGGNPNVNGPRMLANAGIQSAIETAIKARSERTEITQDNVLRGWWDLANADPNELIEVRRTCCRYCYGVDHRYLRTAREEERDRAAWERSSAPDKPVEFQELGGIGYDPRKPPSPDCPECFGEGERHVFVKDTRELSSQSRRLYAGVKETKDGIEIKMRDQDAASVNVAKHLGMFVEKHEHTGKDGGPMQMEILTNEERAERVRDRARRILERRATANHALN